MSTMKFRSDGHTRYVRYGERNHDNTDDDDTNEHSQRNNDAKRTILKRQSASPNNQ